MQQIHSPAVTEPQYFSKVVENEHQCISHNANGHEQPGATKATFFFEYKILSQVL